MACRVSLQIAYHCLWTAILYGKISLFILPLLSYVLCEKVTSYVRFAGKK